MSDVKDDNRYWIGDLHGCNETLKALLNKIPDGSNIGFLGDANDRGPDSLGCVKTILSIDNVVCLYGNHEIMMLGGIFHQEISGNLEFWTGNGGDSVLNEFDAMSDDDCVLAINMISKYLYKCQAFYVSDNYFCSHAGIPIDFDYKKSPNYVPANEDDELIWCGSLLESSLFAQKTNKRVLIGHHWSTGDFLRDNIKDNVIILDTSCVRGDCLSAFNPITGDLIQQVCID